MADVADVVFDSFKGKRALLLADCCQSGGLVRQVQKRNHEVPTPRIAAVSSSSAREGSTENWTFTESFLDALEGKPWVDRAADGEVTLRIFRPTRWRRCGFSRVSVRSRRFRKPGPETPSFPPFKVREEIGLVNGWKRSRRENIGPEESLMRGKESSSFATWDISPRTISGIPRRSFVPSTPENACPLERRWT